MAKSSSFKLYLAISMSLGCISFVNAIINGADTTVATYPYACTMRVGGVMKCTSTLVGTKSMLTACDCFEGVTDLPSVIMRCGQTILNNANEGLRRGISAVYKPVDYVKNTGMMNIALAQLKQPMTGTNMAVIALGGTEPTTMDIAGWGKRQATYSNPSQILGTANMQVYPTANCSAEYTTGFKEGEMICIWSGPAGTKTACHMDQGGPGVLNNALVAVMSFGKDGCDPLKPYLCTDVTNTAVKKQITDWIALAQA